MSELLTHPPALPTSPTRTPAVPGPPPPRGAQSGPPHRARAFTGDWLRDGCDCHIYTDGYVGDLIRRWNGWAVFDTTRAVAETIVAHHQHTFTRLMAEHVGRGEHMASAWLATLHQIASITWLGGLIVVDRRLCTADETDVEIATPDNAGRYTIGWRWRWDDVDACDVHTAHGTDQC